VSIFIPSGYCPQDLLILEGLTVAENLRYFAAAYGLSQTNDGWYRAAQGLAERFRCNSFLDTPVSRLSGGSKQKVNLRWPPSRYR